MAQHTQDACTLRIVIIGAGMAGILSAIKLREAGYTNFIIYEKSAALGGTWHENTYPGLACDVPAHLYTYSFEPNPNWSHVYAPGPEIRAYFENVAKKYGVVESIRFREEITSCEFIEGRWQIRMKSGKTDQADVIIAATGVLHHPNIPDIPGLARFRGACFHSAKWDHSVPLDGKRVGVIGTGSTAIQITSALVNRVAKFKLFQRTAQWVLKLPNREYEAGERAAFAKDPGKIAALRAELDQFFGTFSAAVIDAESPQMKQIEAACLANLEETVKDPILCEQLRPHYRAACKRLIMSPDFYEAIQHPNAELVVAGIDAVEPAGVRTKDGVLHELDVLVLATGFRADRFVRPAIVRGRRGVDLDTVWEDHPVAYLSISVPDFPNFFMLNGPNGPVGNFSLIRIAEQQLHYILQLLEKLRTGECREISACHTAAAEFEKARAEAAKKSIWATGCKSWYLDKHGVPASWPWSTSRFDEEMAAPAFDAYEAVR
ncbi:MAG: flavin-containing monooxygenase [Candidatus Binatia bacterium]